MSLSDIIKSTFISLTLAEHTTFVLQRVPSHDSVNGLKTAHDNNLSVMKQSVLKNMMYDFFHILQLFTQAIKYINETGRGHIERPER